MKALWLEDGRIALNDVPLPTPAAGEVLVRVLRAGICNTDLELIRGYYPFKGILGHEFVGLVEDGPQTLVGERVVGEINAVCGNCRACRAEMKTHCANRTVLGIDGRHGAFAEYLTLPVENLHVVPNSVSTDAATFTEPLAAALEIQQQIEIIPGSRVLVVGEGKLGQLIAQTIALTDCNLVVVGRHTGKLKLLADRGIETCLERAVDVGGFDVVVECTGRAGGFALALSSLRPRGTLVMKSTYAGELTMDASRVVVNEITLMGSRCGPFEPALDLLAHRKIDVEPLIHARYQLVDIVGAFERAGAPGVLKVLVRIGELDS
ncbi:MAG: alcohol dehydrogenase catalytic domain-containing protein [Gemmatimonadales bacterium]